MNDSNAFISSATPDDNHWKLMLFVAGQGPKSLLAYANLKKVCETHMRDKHTIEVIDLAKQPALAKEFQVIAVPTLIRANPPPQKRIVGNLSNQEKMVAELDVSSY